MKKATLVLVLWWAACICAQTPDSLSLQSSDSIAEQTSGGLLDGLFPVKHGESIEKGNFLGSVTLSLLQGKTQDDALDIIIGDIYKAEGYTFSVEAAFGYFVKDAMAIGLRGGYSRTWFDIDFALIEDLDIAEHRKFAKNGFFFQPFFKNYLKILDSRNIYLFNETSLSVEYSYGLSQSDDGEDLNRTHTKSWTFELGIDPGVCIMVLKNLAFETSVGLLGLSSSVTIVEENGETRSDVSYNVVNFTIDLLSLELSLVRFF